MPDMDTIPPGAAVGKTKQGHVGGPLASMVSAELLNPSLSIVLGGICASGGALFFLRYKTEVLVGMTFFEAGV